MSSSPAARARCGTSSGGQGSSRKSSLKASASFATRLPEPCLTSPATSDSGEVHVDLGVSPAVDVSDFISNTGVRVMGIATNFNGLTNAVRASNDTVYYLDRGLRLKASSIVPNPPGRATNASARAIISCLRPPMP